MTVFTIVFAFAFCALASTSTQAQGKDKTLHFYTIYGWGDYTDSQYLNIFKKVFGVSLDELGMTGEFRHFKDEEAFFKAIKSTERNVIQVGNREQLVKVIREYGYSPVASYSFLKMKVNRSCLYVREKSGMKTLENLRGKTVTLAATMFEYALLREIVGENLATFFGEVAPSQDGTAPAYEFYLEKPDALFITDQMIGFLKVSNPEVVKNIRQIGCSREYAFMPMLVSRDLSRETIQTLFKKVVEVISDKKTQASFSLFAFFDTKLVETGMENYNTTFELYDIAV
jgi:ABC-type phosphate/phosphonate transport system substrate-binding protein